jgi:hypothetical protein
MINKYHDSLDRKTFGSHRTYFISKSIALRTDITIKF